MRCLKGVAVVVFALALLIPPISAVAQSANDDLFRAVELNDLAGVEAAIEAGAQISGTNDKGMTAADLAVDLGHFRIAHALLAYRNGGSQAGPRVTEKGRTALSAPSNRLRPKSAPATAARPAPAAPDPKLANIVPPRKPTTIPSLPSAPEATPTKTIAAPPPMPAPKPMPKPSPGVVARPDDGMAAAEPSEGGVLDSVLGGLKSIVTLGGLFGGDDDTAQQSQTATSTEKSLPTPADRFAPQSEQETAESSAGRMMDRLKDSVTGPTQQENEFGLPTAPVLPPLDAPGMAAPVDGGIPGMAPPVETAESVPGMGDLPPLDAPETTPGDIPGLAAPIEVTPPDTGIEIPGLAAPVGTPSQSADLLPPDLPSGDTPGVAGLPPGLEIPGVAELPDEVPGIIAPPAVEGEAIPALPPGLEPLPGSNTGRLRRPDGLVQPEDPTALPAPGSQDLQTRIQRLDAILRRTPVEVTDRYRTGVGVQPTAPRSSGAPLPAPTTPVAPAPAGETQIPGLPATAPAAQENRDPQAILRRARDAAKMRAEIEAPNRVARPTETSPEAQAKLKTPHALRPPAKAVTARDDPTVRLIDRLKSISDRQYEHEDIYGLPVVRPTVDGAKQPRQDVDVAELPEMKKARADDQIHKLARFFRGDQEQEAGMVPPPTQPVETSPLPRVVDNLVPENDPARGRVVDDSLLDLSGVEQAPPSYRGQAGATPTTSADLNPNFLDRLSNVLGPTEGRRRSVEQPIPPAAPGTIGLENLDVPTDQIVPAPKPDIPDPWTMTIEKSEGDGQKRTLGVTAISPEDGSQVRAEQGVVTQMVGRIRELLSGPEGARGPDVSTLDDAERQKAAEDLLSEALRDGAPTALPDQNQWPVTEVEAGNATPGVPPPPRPGVLTRTSLTDVVLSLGESVTLENTLPPQQDGIDPLNECIKKNRGSTLFCVEPIDWPSNLQPMFMVPTILYTGPMAITRYDQGSPSRFHSLFDSNEFEDIVAYYQARYGEPTEIWKRSIAPLAKPRQDNPTVSWRSRDTRTNIISVLEIRKFDDSRGGFPDTNRGAVMLYHLNAPSIFPQVSSHELMRLRRTR